MAGGSALAVYTAIAGNSLVMVAKFGAFAFTGSGAMLSEGIHSLADVGNQVLLAIGLSAAEKEPDEHHPYGYQRDRFVWALISAVGIFFLGCGVTVYHGIHSLLHPEPIEHVTLALGVLGFAVVVEGGTLWVAYRAVSGEARAIDMSFKEFVASGQDPMGVAVLLEDGAAVLGVILAAISLVLTMITGDPVFDGIASIVIGLLLGAIAIFLIRKNREALLGKSMRPEARDALVDRLNTDPVVDAVLDVKALRIGGGRSRFKAEIDFDGEQITRRRLTDADLAAVRAAEGDEELRAWLEGFGARVIEALGDEVDRLEGELRSVSDRVEHIDLEAD